MTETRYASLSGNLLARKGGAKPAMRPRHIHSGTMIDDLGWDDMGDAAEPLAEHVPSSISALTPAPRPVREESALASVAAQQRALAEQFAKAEEAGETEEAQAEAEAEPILEAQAGAQIDAPRVAPRRRPAEVVVMPRRKAAVEGRKAAFTLRIEPERHLRLRLATAVTGRSAQNIVTAALDQFIESLPEIRTLAEQLPSRSKRS